MLSMDARLPEAAIAVEEAQRLERLETELRQASKKDKSIARRHGISVDELNSQRGYNEMTKALSLMGQSSIGT